MSENRLTPENFDTRLRDKLRYGHGFEPADLDKTRDIMSEAIAHVQSRAKTNRGMGAEHLDIAMKFLNEEHKGWRALPEHKRNHIENALKDHFDITESEAE